LFKVILVSSATERHNAAFYESINNLKSEKLFDLYITISYFNKKASG